MWNINGGLENKLSDKSFCIFIFTYDIIFLSEWWIPNNYELKIDGFNTCIIPGSLTSHSPGGGMIVIFISNRILFWKHDVLFHTRGVLNIDSLLLGR